MGAVARVSGFGRASALRDYHPACLAALWVGMQVLCWRYYQGPHLLGDGKQYLAMAQDLAATGRLPAAYYRHYVGYVAFIALFLKLGLGLRAVALAQVALSGVAACAFYRTARQLTKQHWPSAALATAAWVSWLSVQACNPFILTESLFTSCLVLCLWALVRLGHGRSITRLLVLLLLLFFTAAVRPNGFVVLAAAGAAGLRHLWHQQKRAWALAILLVGFGAGLVLINSFIEQYNVLDEFARGTVIFGYEPARLQPPAALVLPAGGWPIGQLAFFAAHNLWYFSKLCAAKIGYFLGYPRPWYSLVHRLWAFGLLPLVYGLAVAGGIRRAAAAPVRLYLATALVMQIGIVMLATEDWDSRFSAPFVAYWLQLAAIGSCPLRSGSYRPGLK